MMSYRQINWSYIGIMFLVGILIAPQVYALKALNLPVPIEQKMRTEVFGDVTRSKSSFRRMMLLKQAANSRNWSLCLQRSSNLSRFPAQVRDVVKLQKFNCLMNYEKKSDKNWNLMADWSMGPSSKSLSHWVAEEFEELKVRALLDVFKRDLRANRKRAWKSFGLITQTIDNYDRKEVAEIYKTAGEMAFLQQKMPIALQYWEQSLSASEAADLRTRYARLKKEMGIADSGDLTSESSNDLDLTLRFSAEEIELEESISRAISTGKYTVAFSDYLKLTKSYPGSAKLLSLNTDIRRAFVKLFSNKDKKFSSMKSKVLGYLRELPLEYSKGWIGKFYFHDLYDVIVDYYRGVKDKLLRSPRGAETLLLIGRSAVHQESWAVAKDVFELIVKRFSGSDENIEARFRLALVYIRMNLVPQAMSELERLLRLTDKDSIVSRTLYWLWRCSQIMKQDQANDLAQRLVREYPFYYYGVLARAELNNGVLDFSEALEFKPSKVKLFYSDEQIRIFQRFKILVQAGWYGEAQNELRELPIPTDVSARLQFVELFITALNYSEATDLLINTWNIEPRLKHPVMLQKLFPKEYSSFVSSSAKSWSIHPFFVWSVMRQESLFDWQARSPANALGLMQIIPPTARDIVSWLRLRNVEIPADLAKPKLNIEMGTHYLSRLLRKYKGHVPLALSAYNAGPGNTDRWLKGRRQLKSQLYGGSSEVAENTRFIEDLWVEELPWDETNGYVLRIIRNWMVYQVFDNGKFELTRPLWKGVLTEGKP